MQTTVERVIRDFTVHPLALLPAKLEELQGFIARRHARTELTAAEIRRITAQAPRQSGPAPAGVALIPLHGVLFHRAGGIREASGGTSAERFAAQVEAAASDDGVSHIVIDANTPGGSVSGIEEAAAVVFEARQKKRITAVANSLMASAGYWIGSAAHEIVATPSAIVGSIGVVSLHTEFSRMDERMGVKTTVISSGDFKAEANPYEPLTDEARAAIQAVSDEFYRQFTEAVALHRGTTAEAVRAGYGRGRALPAEQALAEDLIDRVGSLHEVLGELGVGARPTLVAASAPDELAAAADMYVTGWDAIVAGANATASSHVTEPTVLDAQGDASDEPTDPPHTEPAPEAREHAMSDKDTAAQNGAANEVQQDQQVITAGEDRAKERERSAGIANLCQLHGVPERAGGYIEEGLTVDQVGHKLGVEAQGQLKAMSATAVDLTEKESKEYSISRAIMAQAEHGENWSGFEREVSDEIAAKLPKDYKSRGGAFVPTRLRHRLGQQDGAPSAALNTGTATEGQELVFTERGPFIDLLRARMRVIQLGATTLSGLRGPVAFPKQDGAGVFSWVPEDPGSDLGDSDASFTQVALTPKTGQSTTAYSRQLLIEGLPDVDMIVQNDLALITALGIDAAAIEGGATNQPVGILETAGVGVVPIAADGGAPTLESVVALETAVATANADIGALAYLTTPGVRGKLKTTEEFASANGRPVWMGGPEGELNGYRAMVSTQVPSDLTKGTGTNLHAIIFGVWSQLLIGYWGAYELIVDPFALKKQGLIEVTAFQMAGVAIRHPAAFAVIVDADPAA